MNVLINDMGFFSLSKFDFLIFAIIGFSMLFAVVRGFTKSIISLSGWIIALAIGMKFYFILEPIVNKYVTIGVVASVIAGISLFLISAIIIAILNNIFYIAFEAISGGLLDRSLGLLFGFLRGLLLVSFIFYILLLILPQLNVNPGQKAPEASSMKMPKWAHNSRTILLLNKGASMISQVMPLDFKRKLGEVLANEVEAKKDEGMAIDDQHSGATIITPTTPSAEIAKPEIDKPENATQKILDLLPKEIMGKISQDNLVILQDELSTPKEKADILEEIRKEYQDYMDSEDKIMHDVTLSQEDIAKADEEHHKLMSMIEAQINEYSGEKAPITSSETIQTH